MRTLSLPLLIALGLLASILAVRAQDQGPKVSVENLFSYHAPAGWKIHDAPGSKYPIALAPVDSEFIPNINVDTDPFPGSLDDYAAHKKTSLASSAVYAGVQIVDEKSFETETGLRGVRLVVNDLLGDLHLHQVLYLFGGSANTKFVITATTLADDAARDEPLFDASLKTFLLP